MSPVREPTVLAGQRYTLRVIGPRSKVFPTSPAPNRTLLNRTDMVAKPLPMVDVPGSPDFVSGSWTTRLGDAGEASLTFPNALASDGVQWRDRFDIAGHLIWIEIRDNSELDFVGVIDQVQVNPQQVQIHASDPWWLLKKAYERDWVVAGMSPRDVIERATQLWVPCTADNFPAGALSSQWLNASIGGGSAAIGPNGGLILTAPASGDSGGVASSSVTLGSPTGIWRVSCAVSASLSSLGHLSLFMGEDVHQYEVALFQGGNAVVNLDGTTMGQLMIPGAPSYSLMLESDGEWVTAFLNGAMITGFRRAAATTTTLSTEIHLLWGGGGTNTATILNVLSTASQPFLQ